MSKLSAASNGILLILHEQGLMTTLGRERFCIFMTFSRANEVSTRSFTAGLDLDS